MSVLFWSGGKDSYLAWRERRDEAIVLLTTFDAKTRVLAHQELPIEVIVQQAKQLELPLIGVPLLGNVDYLEALLPALRLVPNCAKLIFGDLHLDHIRSWRESLFTGHAQTGALALDFPLWKCAYEELHERLVASGSECLISAVDHPALNGRVGERFDQAWAESLPAGIDAFGENGEFHTRMLLLD